MMIIELINYMAPELINCKDDYNFKNDIWSLGCIIYELCTLKICFESEFIIDLIHKIANEEHGKIDLNFYPPGWQHLIDLLLKKNFEERPNIDEVYNLLIKLNENNNLIKAQKEIYIDKLSNNIINREDEKSEINMVIEIKDEDNDKYINLMNNENDIEFEEGKNFIHNYKGLIKLEKNNIELLIDGIKTEYNKKEKFLKGVHDIRLKFKIKMKNCNKMFKECKNLILIDLLYFNTKNVVNMSEMFCNCHNLMNLDLSSFFTKNVTDMSKMFYNCNNLLNINISFFNIENTKNISGMFYNCEKLNFVTSNNISKWNTQNIADMSYLFYGCLSLNALPDISNWNTSNVKNISFMFNGYTLLTSLPDISKWDINNISDLSGLFGGCQYLKIIPDISKWKISDIINMSYLFYNCFSLISLPDISKWKINNIINMSFIFTNCSSLQSLPDISNWNFSSAIDLSYMFYGSSSLKFFPDFSKWDSKNVINMSYMFYGCSSIQTLPDISKWNTSNVNNLSYLFYGCSSLKILPDICKWNISNVTDMKMFISNCSSLSKFPDFSKWTLLNPYIDDNFSSLLNIMENKIELKDSIKDDILKFIPQIELKFNDVSSINEDLIPKIKDEIKKLIKKDNFSIIEIKKGSLTVIITLQYIIFEEIRKDRNMDFSNISNQFILNIEQKVKNISTLLKEHEFICLGTKTPNYIDNNIINIIEEKNQIFIRDRIQKFSKEEENQINLFEAAKSIEMEELERFYVEISLIANEQENNLKKYINNLDIFNNLFDQEIEKALTRSIFEYKIINIFVVEREINQYLQEKSKCPNKETKILFHGTTIDGITGILSSQFKDSNKHIFGKGVYFTDLIDYAWYYSGKLNNRENFCKIPKVGDTFSVVANEIYYYENKIEIVYNIDTKEKEVEKNAIRCAKVNYKTKIMEKIELDKHKGVIWNEFLITDRNQILPLYAVTFKRIEYLVIWRDYNFSPNNPNNYSNEVFIKMQEFHRKIKNILLNELNSKIYFTKNSEEALALVKRKRYNKIIIITNGNNNGKDFILKSREIIGSEAIAAVSAYDVENHIKWVKNMPNVLLLNGINFHEKFFKIVINDYKYIGNIKVDTLFDKVNELREEIINYYKDDIPYFDFSELNKNSIFYFPHFKESGNYSDLNFDSNSTCAVI